MINKHLLLEIIEEYDTEFEKNIRSPTILEETWYEFAKKILSEGKEYKKQGNKTSKSTNSKDFQVQVGSVTNIRIGLPQPQIRIPITLDQKIALEYFAATRKSKDLSIIYTINDVDFKIVPFL